MAKQLFSNNGSAFLAASISDSDLTIQVQNGFGGLYPNPGADEYFLVTLENEDGDIEIVMVTSRATDLLTVPPGGRGQEGTSAQSWTNGQARVECRITGGTLEQFIQRTGDAMEGNLDMDGNELQDAILTGTGTQILAGEIVNVPLRGVSGDSSNEVIVPTDGGRATAGGAEILVEGDTENIRNTAFAVGMLMLWYGAAIDCPDGWAICDGTGGTPDMRERVAIGVGGALAVGDPVGAATATPTIGNAGAHSHTGNTGSVILDETNMPEHTHRLWVWESGSNGPGQIENFAASGLGPARGVAGNADSNTYAYRQAVTTGQDLIEPAGGDGAGHAHTISAEGDHTHSSTAVSTLQPSRALHYIMFVGV